MKKFFVLFAIPAVAIQEWMTNVDEATRKQQSDQMMQEWNAWLESHKDVIVDKGLPLGKTKRIDANGVSDGRNDYNWYLIVNAESAEAAAEMFVGHPQIASIPTSYIEVMGTAGMPSA
jgi:hypothetical protein